jgi:hypothetical protein
VLESLCPKIILLAVALYGLIQNAMVIAALFNTCADCAAFIEISPLV